MDGGLGVKDLELQNHCLLMKFIDKLFSNEDTPWKGWILHDTDSYDATNTSANSYLWKIIMWV